MAAKQKILIVDDDNNIAELISLYLTKECFDTKIVKRWGGGTDRIRAVQSEPYFARSDVTWNRRLSGVP